MTKKIGILIILLLVPSGVQASFLTDNWLSREYRDFRAYPRMDKAYKLIEAEKYADAIPLLQKVLEIEPANKRAYIALVEVCLQLGKYNCVIETATRWNKQDPSDPLAIYYLAFAYHHKKQSTLAIDNALILLKNHLLLEPERISVILDILISELANEGRAQEVVFWDTQAKKMGIVIRTRRTLDWSSQLLKHDFYKEANQLLLQLPYEQRVIEARVVLLEKWGKSNEAAHLLETETKPLLKKSSHYWLQLAELYQKGGDISDELRTLRMGIQQVEENQPLYHALLNRMIGLKHLSESAELVEAMLKEEDDTRLRMQLVDLLAATKNYDAAIEQVKIILSDTSQSRKQTLQLNRELAYFLDKSNRSEELLQAEDKYRLLAEDEKRLQLLAKSFPFPGVPPSHRDYLVLELIKLYVDKNEIQRAAQIAIIQSNKDLFSQKMADNLLVYCQSINRCDLVIRLAERQIHLETATGYTYLVAGYCLSNMNKPGLALDYMKEAKKQKLTSEEYRSLLKAMGYLAAEQSQTEEALAYWRECLEEKFNVEIAIHTVLLALTTHHEDFVEPYLTELGKSALHPDQMAQYVFAVGLVAESEGRLARAHVLYETSLLIDPTDEVRHRLSSITKMLGETDMSIVLVSDLILDQPQNSLFYAERGYLYAAEGRDEEAVRDFITSHELVADRMTLTPEIAYTLLRLGKRKEALNWFYQAVDESPYFTLAKDPGAEEDRRFGLRSAIQTLEDQWKFLLSSVVRLDTYGQEPGYVSPVAYASYRGFYSGEVSYRFDELPGGKQNGRFYLYGRELIGMKDQSLETRAETLTFGLGIKYQLLQAQNLYLSAERVIGAGEEVADEWMLRLQGSYGIGNDFKPSLSSWLTFQAYGDISYLLDQQTYYSFFETDLGYQFKLPTGTLPSATLYPYLTSRYTNNNGNIGKDMVDRLDIGAGIGLNSWHLETKYRVSGLHSELRLEGRTKITGNMKDESTVHLVWELFF